VVPERALNQQALGPEAKTFVTRSLKEFCTGLYTDAVCPRVSIISKQRWGASTYLGGSDIPTQKTDAILGKEGRKCQSKMNGAPCSANKTTLPCRQLVLHGRQPHLRKIDSNKLEPGTVAGRTCKMAKISL